MLKRWMTTFLLVIIVSACSLNTAAQQNPDAEKDALLSSPKPASATPVVTEPLATATLLETQTPVSTDTPIPSLTPMDSVVGPDNFPADVNPLTGLQVLDPSILERRPVSVKVQIFPRGQRPPMGISQADIVFDYYQNTGMTRFHAIFYGSDSAQVGPIRSGRLLDKDLVQMYGSYLAFGSADQRILNTYYSSDMSDRLILEWSGKCPPMCRIDPNGSNMLVADTAALSTYASENKTDNAKQNLNGMAYYNQPPSGGSPVDQISVRFSISAYTRWDYDPTSGQYLRFQDIQEAANAETEVLSELVDKNTGEQITSNNIVVLFVPHKFAFNTKAGNNEIVDVLLEGSGPAYAFRDGQVYELEWHRTERNTPITLTFPDGSIYQLKPGNTWFEVIGQTSKMETSEEGKSYRFEWAIP